MHDFHDNQQLSSLVYQAGSRLVSGGDPDRQQQILTIVPTDTAARTRHPQPFAGTAADSTGNHAGNPGDHSDAVAVRRQHAAGQHAAMVAMGDAGLAVDAFCELECGDSVPRCGGERGMAGFAGVSAV